MKFDPSGLKRAFDRMDKSAQTKGKTMAEDQGNLLLKTMKVESWKVAPTSSELNATAAKLKGRLKRKKGTTPLEELNRRHRARGIFARKWEITKTKRSKYKIQIWMIDNANQSAKVDAIKKVTDKAERKTGRSYTEKLNKLADQVTGVF